MIGLQVQVQFAEALDLIISKIIGVGSTMLRGVTILGCFYVLSINKKFSLDNTRYK